MEAIPELRPSGIVCPRGTPMEAIPELRPSGYPFLCSAKQGPHGAAPEVSAIFMALLACLHMLLVRTTTR